MNENDIWLIAGLGNHEAKYDGTRHNAPTDARKKIQTDPNHCHNSLMNCGFFHT